MHRQHLAGERTVEFSEHQAVKLEFGAPVVTVGSGFRGLIQIDQTRLPRGHLNAAIAKLRRPAAKCVERMERRFVSDELGQKQPRPLDRARRSIRCLI